MKFGKVQKVTVKDPKDKVELTCMEGYGIFTVFVEDSDFPQTGASACFNVAGNKSSSSINKSCGVTGLDGESLQITWVAGERPKLSFSGKPSPEFLPKRYLVYAGALSANAEK